MAEKDLIKRLENDSLSKRTGITHCEQFLFTDWQDTTLDSIEEEVKKLSPKLNSLLILDLTNG